MTILVIFISSVNPYNFAGDALYERDGCLQAEFELILGQANYSKTLFTTLFITQTSSTFAQ